MVKGFFLTACLLFYPALAGATTYWVSGGGGGNCATATGATDPKVYLSTIQAGLNCVGSAGDIVNVKTGTYAETVNSWPSVGAVNNPIIVQAAPGNTPTWRGGGGGQGCHQCGAVSIVDRSFIRIQGFTFTGDTTGAVILAWHSAGTNKTSPHEGIEILNNTFSGNGNDCTSSCEGDITGGMSRQILLYYYGRGSGYGGSTHNLISGNTFTNNYGRAIEAALTSDTWMLNNVISGATGSYNDSTLQYDADGIVGGGLGTYLERNIVRGNTISGAVQVGSQQTEAVGIRLDSGGQGWTIDRNTIFNMGTEGPAWNTTRHFAGIMLESGCNDNIVTNNIIYSIAEVGIHLGSWPTTAPLRIVVYNNTLYNTGQIGIFLENAGSTQVRNNIVSGSMLALVFVTPESIAAGSNSFSYNQYYKPGTTLFGLWNQNASIWISGNLNLANWANVSGETDGQYGDPVYISAGTNFALQSGSPARNTGLTIGTVTTDFLGTTRPQGANYDRGAYEYVEGQTPIAKIRVTSSN